ncbi:ATP-binding cassette domain-containing protein [uncultured Friedmanniella sp.]|uniref:ATP-binding cassette domain-containing protein n=1 Tax=uncultured Friedmanniella sp. TaxID=335381 RepID=UPI0035CA3F34
MTDASLLEVRDVFVAYATAGRSVMALRGADLSLRAGERLLVQGPNGSGKSTLLRVITGEQPVAAGTVAVGDAALHTMGAAERRRWRARAVGFVDQHARRSLLPELSVLDNVALQLWTTGRSRRQARTRAAETLDQLGLASLASSSVPRLSGGEAARVAIGAAVAHHPSLVLADEPTGELDASAAAEVYDLLSAVAARGSGVIVVSHDPRTIAYADRAVRIRDGRTAEQWYPDTEREEQVLDSRGWIRVPTERFSPAPPTGLVAHLHRDHLRLDPVRVDPSPAAEAPEQSASRPRTPVAASPDAALALLSGVAVRFGPRTVFTGLDLALGGGEWAVVSGPSGSGKTTLLALLAGLTDPSAGTVRVAGRAWTGLDRSARADFRRRWVALSPQQASLLEALTVRENLEVAAAVRGEFGAPGRVSEVADALGLAPLLERRAGLLSGGERQRTSLARCLVSDAPLLLLDEPTSQQDDASAAAVLDAVLAELAVGRALLVASHDPRFVGHAPRTVRLG